MPQLCPESPSQRKQAYGVPRHKRYLEKPVFHTLFTTPEIKDHGIEKSSHRGHLDAAFGRNPKIYSEPITVSHTLSGIQKMRFHSQEA